MSPPGSDALFAALEATWPPAATLDEAPWRFRDGAGGGKRVSATTATGTPTAADIDTAEARMAAAGHRPLFAIRPGDETLDALLATRGYDILDRTVILTAPTTALTGHVPPRLTAIEVFPPLAIMREIWAEGGIGPERIAVMERAAAPRTSFLGRHADRAVAAVFVAAAHGVAFVHALEVLPDWRRHGVARNLMAAAAHWASAVGARQIAVAVTEANAPARNLYASLGLMPVEKYHYRVKPG